MSIQGSGAPAASFKFNNFEEIKSHSSVLFNERLAILFYLLDMNSMELKEKKSFDLILKVHAINKQIYKNIRSLIRNNPTMRATLNLDTKDPGIYTIDVAFARMDKMIEFCEVEGHTYKRTDILIKECDDLEVLQKDIMQYFHYFIRPDFRQKPDVEIATEQYKAISDSRTVEELRALVGKSSKLDFEGLGSSRIELQESPDSDEESMISYDEDLDGEEQKT